MREFLVNLSATALMGFAVATPSMAAVKGPATALLEWPAKPTATLVKQSLADVLEAVKGLKDDWNGHAAFAAARASVAAAERLLPELPDLVAEVRAGIDDERNVYFKLSKNDKVAYLTVEPNALHLVCMSREQGNVYVDDEPFRKKLPIAIRNALTSILK